MKLMSVACAAPELAAIPSAAAMAAFATCLGMFDTSHALYLRFVPSFRRSS
jgi:hypothetical protein